MHKMKDHMAHYLAEFETVRQQLSAQDNDSLKVIREAAYDYFSKQGFPTRKNEEWKYTSVDAIASYPFTSFVDSVDDINKSQLVKWQIANLDCYQVVFVNGIFSEKLSVVDDLEFSTLSRMCMSFQRKLESREPRQYPWISASAGMTMTDTFTALNTAFMRDGLVLVLKKNTILTKPIHIMHITTQPNLMTNTRNFIHLESGASATLIESYVGNDQAYFSNTVTEVDLADQSQFFHYKIQQQGNKAMHIDRLLVKQHVNSNLQAYSFSIGGELVRSDTHVQCAEGVTSELYGLYLGQHKQHIDHHTVIHHAKGHGRSYQRYKGILDQQARGVFNGKVIVEKAAQKTDAKQYNNNLLLSKTAEVASKPQLEIAADDVKCAHGATVGQLEEQAVFYLQTRGISRDQAKQLLVCGFACDIIEKIKLTPVKQKLQELIEGIIWSHQ